MEDGGKILLFSSAKSQDNLHPSDVERPEPPKPEPTSSSWDILQDAANLTEGERQEQHGTPEKCHDEIAKLWAWWMGVKLDRHDVAMMLSLLKTARIKTGAPNRDCYVDGAAYNALAGRFRFPKD